MELGQVHPTFRKELGCRIEEIVAKYPKKSDAADIAGISVEQLNKWIQGKVKVPVEGVYALARGANVDLNWALSGAAASNVKQIVGSEYVGIPRYNASLSAGNGFWNEEKAELLDHIPFTEEFLRRRLGRPNAKDLLIMSADGESMEPQISDGDLVMIDQKKQTLKDGIFAFVHNGEARIKWLRKTIAGDIEVISLNKNGLFPKEIIEKDDTDAFQLIGKVVWCGHHFAR